LRRFYLIPFALLAVAAFAQDEEEPEAAELAAPEILAFTITDGSAPSKELESAVGRARGAFEEKPVLFLTVNLASAGSRNQSEMLFFSLGLGLIWEECKKSPAQLVLVKLETVTVLGKHSSKENLAEAINKHLADEGEGCEGCEGSEGCDGGDEGGGG
jgi:hypothetical protein